MLDKETVANMTKSECMGCKVVAFVTPPVISAYIYSQCGTKEKLKTLYFAKEWTGKQRWRYHTHRFNMAVLVPFSKYQSQVELTTC